MEMAGQPQHDNSHHHPHAPGPMAELVFIGYHLNRELVVARLSEQTETVWY